MVKMARLGWARQGKKIKKEVSRMAVCKINIKKSLIVLMVMSLCSLISNSGFCSDEMERRSLKGIKGIFVFVEKLPNEVEKAGLRKDQINTDVELKLRMEGIKVVSEQELFSLPEIHVSL